jgi:uncharacterized protein YerC
VRNIDRAARYRKARTRVDRIKVGLDGLQDLCDEVADSYLQRDWYALGYRNWGHMCDAEFSSAKIRLPANGRGNLVRALRDAGMSYRAIAAATGESKSTIARAASAVPNGTPESTLPLDAAPVVVGIDGKRYPVPAPRAGPVVPPSPATFAARRLRSAVDTLDGAVRAGATLTPDERREVGGYLTRLRMLIGDEDTYDDVWNERSIAAYRRLRRRARP